MRNTVSYEWDYEILDELGEEIVDHNHRDTLAEFRPDDITTSLVLVRNFGSENSGLQEREWAYVVNGKLPEWFEDAFGAKTTKVPQRFHKELAKYLSKNS